MAFSGLACPKWCRGGRFASNMQRVAERSRNRPGVFREATRALAGVWLNCQSYPHHGE